MSVRHWIVAGLLVLAGMGSALAGEADGHDVVGTGHASAESSARDSGSSGGDLLNFNHDSAATHRSSESDGGSNAGSHAGTAGGSERGGRVSTPSSARPAPQVGWQSLLPGSIQ